ncbi:hypothetical protein [Paenibacillus alvei]|uniref:YopX protein domain-containing protein n=1 Tax=Paenibacillus alvei TaxID=44250 RepID=A0A383RGG6_PAEAL|nr:hypothetical protein [Paenibacillus alvei]SYX85913.1 putative Protein YopX [Paenibacillus alvei]
MSRPIRYQIFDNEEKKIYTYEMLSRSEDLQLRFGVKGLFLVDTSREDEDGYDYEMDIEFLQFSGMHDDYNNPDGEELYDLDIVEMAGLNFKEGTLGVVVYDTNQGRYKLAPISAYLQNAGNGGWTGYDMRYAYEKVGNVLSHPHLLKGEGADV